MARLLGASLMLSLLFAPATAAHPLSTFGVQLNLTDRTVTVVINADPDPLALKLAALSGSDRAGLSATEWVRRQAPVIESRSVLRIGAQRVALTVTDIRVNADGQIEVALRGTMPQEGRSVTWRSLLIFGTYPLSVTYGTDTTESLLWIDGTDTTPELPVVSNGAGRAAFAQYLWLGITHIVPKGLDHILFIVALFLLMPTLRLLLVQATIFTLAHSVSLALAVSGLLVVPAVVVEPLIAVSIVYVAVQALLEKRVGHASLAMVGVFGLLHGLGFAGVLAELSLPADQWLIALAGFNLGVEVGQLTVIGLAAATTAAAVRIPWVSQAIWRRAVSGAIVGMGAFWVITRLM